MHFAEDERYKIPGVGGEINGIDNISIKCGRFQNVNNIGIIYSKLLRRSLRFLEQLLLFFYFKCPLQNFHIYML